MKLSIPKYSSVVYFGLVFLVLVTAVVSHNAHAQTPCPCHVFLSSTAPSSPTVANDNYPTELGVQFKPQADGYITGVRFYKDTSMTDTHIGNLWDASGNLLASGTFTGETSTGWQDLTFASPVPVTANTLYTASFYTVTGKYIASSNYFTTAVNNYPLIAPDTSSVTNGNGVFATGSDSFPHSSYNASNYWVDVTFRQTIDGSAPQVTNTTPSNGATGVFIGSNSTVTLSQALDPTTVSSSTAALTDSSGVIIATTITYDSNAHTITLTPQSPLTKNATYTVTIRGGNGGIQNLDGTTMAANYPWSFTTGTDTCPCSIWNNAAPSGTPTTYTGTNGGEEFGTTIHADSNGYLMAVRFYKPLRATATTHAVHVWTMTGTLLASGMSTHETAAGWQEVPLSTPVPVQQGTNYIISYYSSDNTYTYSLGGLTTQVGTGILHANANGAWYYPGADVFPNQNGSGNASVNFWADAVFTTTSNYVAPFTVAVSQPLQNAYGVSPDLPITFKLTTAVDTTTLGGTVALKDANGQTVAGAVTYDDTEHTISFTPSQPLTANVTYTALLGGGMKNIYGTGLTPYTLTFSTGSALSSNINQGMGGPILVLTSTSNPYDTYLAEMLRAEGINYFEVKDISTLSTTTLANYRLVLLGKTTLTAAQVTTLTNWVSAGGNMITFQPDKQLASLLGLTDQNQTLNEGYLKVNSTVSPGQGITAETMQYHGSADLYGTTSGTQVVATLFSDATTMTTAPAITERSVGSGHVGVFTYDLPRSIALTHQGNPAWAGQERDGNPPIRPNDLFYGNGSTDWLNTSKAHIPQADEQQQLLTNMLLTMTQPSSPMPRYWILPHGLKSALVMLMDDHATATGTNDIFNDIYNYSATNCSVLDWACQRSGSLLYANSGLTASQAAVANSLGFTMGVHVQTGCSDYTSYDNLNNAYITQIGSFRAVYGSVLPLQNFDRTHCYVWSDWDSVPKVDIANGMRINYNYEWYPSTWTGSNTGYLTGSGLAMRFTDANGNLLDTYQAVTDLDYETDATSATMNTDLDNTINSNEFYGVLGTHYDTSGTNYYQLLIAAAMARNIPMISPSQLAIWKDALSSSSFVNIASTPSKLTFTTQVAQGGEGMQAMIPLSTANGELTSITKNTTPVSYTSSTVKGVTYAIFDAQPGTYEALYGTQPSTSTGTSTTSSTSVPVASSHQVVTASAPMPTQTTITNQSPFTSTTLPAENQQAGTSAKANTLPSPSSGNTKWVLVGVGVILFVSLAWFIVRRWRSYNQ